MPAQRPYYFLLCAASNMSQTSRRCTRRKTCSTSLQLKFNSKSEYGQDLTLVSELRFTSHQVSSSFTYHPVTTRMWPEDNMLVAVGYLRNIVSRLTLRMHLPDFPLSRIVIRMPLIIVVSRCRKPAVRHRPRIGSLGWARSKLYEASRVRFLKLSREYQISGSLGVVLDGGVWELCGRHGPWLI